jgi:recombination protein RecA
VVLITTIFLANTYGYNMKFLKDFNKTVSKMGEGVNTDTSPPDWWFGSGNYVLNKIIAGNFDRCIGQGRVTGLAGPSGAGKSFLLANIIKQAQKEGAYILLLDSEGAFDDDWATAIGIDVTSENYNCIQVCTIPQVVKIVSSFTKGYREDYPDGKGPKVLIAVDSCDMLMTDSESEKYDKGNPNADQGQHPKQIKQMLKTFVNDIKSLYVSMIVTKQVYPANHDQLLKGEGAWVVNDAIRYSLSQIMLITKLKLKSDSGITGIRMKVEGFKTRFAKPFQQVTIEVPYDTGMNPYSGLLDVAVNMGIVTKRGAWNYIEGTDISWSGEKNTTEAHYSKILELAATKDVFLQVDEEDDVSAAASRQKKLMEKHAPKDDESVDVD